MKITLSTYTFPPEIGGVATTEAGLAAAFAAAGHETTVATLTRGARQETPFRVKRRPSAVELYALYAKSDIIILANLSLRLAFPLLFLNRPFGLRHHSQSAWTKSVKHPATEWMRKKLTAKAVHFMTSEFIGKRSGLEYYVTSPFPNPAALRCADRRPPTERSGVLFAGRLVEEKGVRYLLEHWPLIHSALGGEPLTLIGDGPLRAEVEARIASRELADVRYLGPKTIEESAKEMMKSAYVVTPSLWSEPFGAVALEAVAAGAIVLHSGRGGLPEATAGLGFTFDPDRDETLVRAAQDARAMREAHLRDETTWRSYLARVDAHSARFAPQRVVETIINAFGVE